MVVTDEIVLAAYANGFDLDSVAPALRLAFAKFASSGSWPSNQVFVVDQRQEPDPSEPDFLPEWDLGLNLGMDHLPRCPNWFAGVEALVAMLRQSHEETGRDFELFLCFRSKLWYQEHLLFVGSAEVDLAWLRAAIERLT
jgi:hypothetical protein